MPISNELVEFFLCSLAFCRQMIWYSNVTVVLHMRHAKIKLRSNMPKELPSGELQGIGSTELFSHCPRSVANRPQYQTRDLCPFDFHRWTQWSNKPLFESTTASNQERRCIEEKIVLMTSLSHFALNKKKPNLHQKERLNDHCICWWSSMWGVRYRNRLDALVTHTVHHEQLLCQDWEHFQRKLEHNQQCQRKQAHVVERQLKRKSVIFKTASWFKTKQKRLNASTIVGISRKCFEWCSEFRLSSVNIWIVNRWLKGRKKCRYLRKSRKYSHLPTRLRKGSHVIAKRFKQRKKFWRDLFEETRRRGAELSGCVGIPA